ncbi:MAG TPA: YbhB/YbcL family Raf kinase inhibitor-like protein [Solirubrobacterales bacterium]
MTASTRVLLALAVAALAFAGCGGGSSDSSSSAVSGNSNPGAPGTASSDANGGPGGDAASAKAVAGGGAAAGSEQSTAGAKHGPPVPQPTGAREPGITPQQRKEATVASMSMQSPSSQASSGGPQALSAEYTCDGKSTSPALRWQGVPQGTAELVLFAMNIQPVEGKLFFDWAVAGLGPDLEEIEAGRLPKGAVTGRNSFGKTGYEICPEGGGETYMFALFAVPKRLSPAQGFEPLALRKAVTDVSANAGLLALSYTRG